MSDSSTPDAGPWTGTDAIDESRDPDAPAVLSNPLAAMTLAASFVLLATMWRFFIECSAGLATVALLMLQGVDIGPTADPSVFFRADVTAVATMISLGGMAAIAGLLARTVGIDVKYAYGLAFPGVVLVAAGFVGGLVVGFFPGWIAEQLTELLPKWLQLGGLDMIRAALLESPLYAQVLMAFAVCIAAPVFEELVFRGFLWRVLEDGVGWPVAWLFTSVLFAAFHIDPVQGTAVLWTGLFLGWLRLASGSVWPPILAHFANNSLATVATFTFEADQVIDVPWWLVIVSIVGTLAIGGVAWAVRPQEPAEED